MVEKGVFVMSDIVRYLYPNYILVELSSFFRLILPLCGFLVLFSLVAVRRLYLGHEQVLFSTFGLSP